MSVSDLVGEIEGVRRRTRRASSGAAVPLALLGLLVALAAPVYGLAAKSIFVESGSGHFDLSDLFQRPHVLTRILRVHPNMSNYRGIGIYWLVAAPLAFGAIAAYYAWRARRTGLSVDGWRVAIAGAGALAALVLTMYFGGAAASQGESGDLRAGNFLNPFLIVALAVFALAWVERSAGVLVAGVAFLTAVVLADVAVYADIRDEGWYRIASWGWATLALGGVLLLAGAVAAVARLVRRA
jgi:hypothetical protein